MGTGSNVIINHVLARKRVEIGIIGVTDAMIPEDLSQSQSRPREASAKLSGNLTR